MNWTVVSWQSPARFQIPPPGGLQGDSLTAEKERKKERKEGRKEGGKKERKEGSVRCATRGQAEQHRLGWRHKFVGFGTLLGRYHLICGAAVISPAPGHRAKQHPSTLGRVGKQSRDKRQ